MKRIARALSRLPRGGEDARPPARPRTRPARQSRQGGDDRARATVLESLQQGSSLEHALVAQVRALLRARDVAGAQALAESLRARPDTETLGRLLCGVVAFHRRFLDLAWERLEGLPQLLWAEHAAREYVRTGLRTDPERTLAEIAELAARRPEQLPAGTWLALIGPLLAIGNPSAARPVLAILDDLATDRDDAKLRERVEGLRPWVEADLDASVSPRHEGPTFAVLDYMRPGVGEGSQNIGDHIQSIAALSHLVRHQGATLTGDPELVELLTHLRERTRPELRLDDVEAEVEVVAVQRDASMYQPVPEGTWTLCFGWYMHPISGYRYGFPLNAALRPIFVSFHCNERALLTEPVVEYLKRYGPVGCRDWTTVYLLLSMGVPAFFSGCLTTTIGTVFPDRPAGAPSDLGVGYVDVRAADLPEGATQYRQGLPEVRGRSFAANCFVALDRLETYRRHERVVTSRLHCYLPLRSLGEPVDFRPGNHSDPRFNGLIGIDDAAFGAMRAGLLGKLEKVFAAILAGDSEDSVYALWHELTAADVAAAEASARSHAEPPAPSAEVTAAIADTVRAVADPDERDRPQPGAVHAAVVLRPGQGPRLRTMIASLTAHTARPLHLSVLADGPRPKLRQELAEACPSVSIDWLTTSAPEDADGGVQDSGSSLTARAALLLAELLPDVDRVVVLPAESVVTADVGALADLDLDGHLFAAPTVVGPDRSSGFAVVHKAAERLNVRTDLSAELLRTAYAAHAFDFDAFTTEVLVLDLARMRAAGFAERAFAAAMEYSLDEREVLHYLAGPDRAVVPPAWSHVPTQATASDPGLTHWTGEAKPWGELFVPGHELWRRYSDA